jgi:predicted nuclease of predicted toxin-antitoxin system
VKLLLDECLDWRLRQDLPGHEVKTVQEMGWAGITNGRLLALAQRKFQVFITGDRNLSLQQHVS